jgi:hypothetical protein
MKIQFTTQYGKFSFIGGNRQVNKANLNSLRKSMEEEMLMSPIIVNEKYEIIDGQHRFLVRKEMGKEIPFIIMQGYGLKQVHTLNSVSKIWNNSEYLDGYADLGNENYIRFRDFKNHYRLNFMPAFSILHSAVRSGNQSEMSKFRNGEMEITKKQVQDAEFFMVVLTRFKSLYHGYKRTQFIYALIRLMRNPKFDPALFINKLTYQQTKLVDCSTVDQYISLIEEIYNYKNRTPVSLRY